MGLTADAVNDFLAQRANDSHLDALFPATKKRREALETLRMSMLKVGDEITTARIRPKYLAGLSGTLIKISAPSRGRQKTVIRLDEESTRRFRQHEWAPEEDKEHEIDFIPLSACFLKGEAPTK